jgi:hypothetical protein
MFGDITGLSTDPPSTLAEASQRTPHMATISPILGAVIRHSEVVPGFRTGG